MVGVPTQVQVADGGDPEQAGAAGTCGGAEPALAHDAGGVAQLGPVLGVGGQVVDDQTAGPASAVEHDPSAADAELVATLGQV
jgi:hypothetical protein